MTNDVHTATDAGGALAVRARAPRSRRGAREAA
jgi:hypothetical protein